jgi:hypothetical protein
MTDTDDDDKESVDYAEDSEEDEDGEKITGTMDDGSKYEGTKRKYSDSGYDGKIEYVDGWTFTGQFKYVEKAEVSLARMTMNAQAAPFLVADSGAIIPIPQSTGSAPGRVRDLDLVGAMDLSSVGAIEELRLRGSDAWPDPESISPLAIVVIKARIKDASGSPPNPPLSPDANEGPYWWYARITVQGKPCPRLFRMPTPVIKRYQTCLRGIESMQGSSLLRKYTPQTSGIVDLGPFAVLRTMPAVYPKCRGKATRTVAGGSEIIDGYWHPCPETRDSRTAALSSIVDYTGPQNPERDVDARNFRGFYQCAYGTVTSGKLTPAKIVYTKEPLKNMTWEGACVGFHPEGRGVLSDYSEDGVGHECVYTGTMSAYSFADGSITGFAGQGVMTTRAWRTRGFGKECVRYEGDYDLEEGMGVRHDGRSQPVRRTGGGLMQVRLAYAVMYEYEGQMNGSKKHGFGQERLMVMLSGGCDWHTAGRRSGWYEEGALVGVRPADDAKPWKRPEFECTDLWEHMTRATRHFFIKDDSSLPPEMTLGVGMMCAMGPCRYQGDYGRHGKRDGYGAFVVYFECLPDDAQGAASVDFDAVDAAVRWRELYQGAWHDDKRNGHGRTRICSAPGVTKFEYEGAWSDDAFHGSGKYKDDDCWYDGQYVSGLKHGSGTIAWKAQGHADWDSYCGEWKAGKMHGVGKLLMRDGTLHDGAFEDGECHGHGKRVWASPRGETYTGRFLRGVADDPQGKETDSNGDVRVGPFVKGARHGWFEETAAADGCVTKVRYIHDQRQKMSKRTALKNAQSELDDLQDNMNSIAYMRICKRLKVAWKTLHDPHAKLESDSEANAETDAEDEE